MAYDPPAEINAPEGEMHLLEHLAELRKRLVYAALAIVAGSLICYAYSTLIFYLLTEPYYAAFPRDSLIGTGPAEALLLKIQVALFGGAIASLPIIFYQIWAFVAPGLYPAERRLVLPFVGASTVLFLIGAGFCYAVIFPFIFTLFRAEYASIAVAPQIRLSEHLSFMMQGLLAFGAVFEMPILILLLARAGLVSHHTLIRYWRHAVLVIFIVAAVLTPPDVITQFLMAGPLLLLYAISIVVAKVAYSRRPAEADPVEA